MRQECCQRAGSVAMPLGTRIKFATSYKMALAGGLSANLPLPDWGRFARNSGPASSPHSLHFACSITCRSNQARNSGGTKDYETAQDRHSFGRVHGPHRIAGLLGARPDVRQSSTQPSIALQIWLSSGPGAEPLSPSRRLLTRAEIPVEIPIRGPFATSA
jgi:hypothetical protein